MTEAVKKPQVYTVVLPLNQKFKKKDIAKEPELIEKSSNIQRK